MKHLIKHRLIILFFIFSIMLFGCEKSDNDHRANEANDIIETKYFSEGSESTPDFLIGSIALDGKIYINIYEDEKIDSSKLEDEIKLLLADYSDILEFDYYTYWDLNKILGDHAVKLKEGFSGCSNIISNVNEATGKCELWVTDCEIQDVQPYIDEYMASTGINVEIKEAIARLD